MSNIRQIRGGPEVQTELVELLRAMLHEAETGALQGVAGIVENSDGDQSYIWSGSGHWVAMAARLHRWADDIVRDEDSDDDEE